MIAGLIARLISVPAVTAIAGNRIYPGSVPQAGPQPSVVFNRISGAPIYTDDGEVGLHEARVQVDCWASTYTAASGLGEAVKGALSAWFGVAGETTFEGVWVLDERDFREGGSNASEYRFRASIDFRVVYRA